MVALSIRQPWAYLIVRGIKDVENRSWPAPPARIGRRIAIHAAKTFDFAGFEWVRRRFHHLLLPRPDRFELGGIVGSAVLFECVTQSTSPWFCGPYGFVFTAPLICRLRPCRGQLKFFNTCQ